MKRLRRFVQTKTSPAPGCNMEDNTNHLSERTKDENPTNERELLVRRLLDMCLGRRFGGGYDFFISYCWADGRTYAVALNAELEKRGFGHVIPSTPRTTRKAPIGRPKDIALSSRSAGCCSSSHPAQLSEAPRRGTNQPLPTAASPEPSEAKPRFSLNNRAIDYSPARRYSSRQKKRVFKFPIH
jgi:hypothetical protein